MKTFYCAWWSGTRVQVEAIKARQSTRDGNIWIAESPSRYLGGSGSAFVPDDRTISTDFDALIKAKKSECLSSINRSLQSIKAWMDTRKSLDGTIKPKARDDAQDL